MSDSEAGEMANVSARLRQLVIQYEETQDRLDHVVNRVDEIEATLESLAGAGEGSHSTHVNRALALRKLLLTAAQAQKGRSDNAGMVQWTYRQVRDQLESNGHGTVHAPQAYRAMEEAADGIDEIEDDAPAGYAMTEDADGNRVIRCSLPALTETAVNEINNAGADGHPRQPTNTEVTDTDHA
jgi:hypothetical protein